MSLALGLTDDLRDRLGGSVGVAAMPIDGALPLHSQEEPAMRRAVPARRAEFSTGRLCARQAMAALGLPPVALPMGPDRAPVWPPGLVGSISHGAGLCAALVADAGTCGGLGIDIEPDEELSDDVADEVLSSEEARAPKHDRRAIFSAKEAVYKAFYPRTKAVWGFDAVTVRLNDAVFVARLTQPVAGWPEGCQVDGHLIRRDGVIVTALALPPLE